MLKSEDIEERKKNHIETYNGLLNSKNKLLEALRTTETRMLTVLGNINECDELIKIIENGKEKKDKKKEN